MTTKTYQDFDLLIEKTGDHYRARVVAAPGGQASVEFAWPFSALEMENLVLRLGQSRRGVRRLDSPEMASVKTFGATLFQTVFCDDVMHCLQRSLVKVHDASPETGLRLRLRLSDTPELIDIPWEYLYDGARNQFLALSVDTPVVRALELPESIEALAVTPPLRVLVMVASPHDYQQLDTEQEWAKLKESVADLERRGLLILQRLATPTLAALQRQLRQAGYHIFHFIGHGSFDVQAEDGMLLFEDENGRGRAVSGQYLGMLLHDERTMRLAILNACEGGRTARSAPFSGVAQSLLQQGVPAVIAMQAAITDQAAITLAHEFYAALADGYPVDAALAEARKAIFAQENDVEWGKPVLYLRAPNGHIFAVDKASLPPTTADMGLTTALPTAAADTDTVAPGMDREAEQTPLSTTAAPPKWLLIAIAGIAVIVAGSYLLVVAWGSFGPVWIAPTPTWTAPTSACVDPQPGLRAWWRGDGTAADDTGMYPGTLERRATFSAGYIGQAFQLDGQSFVRVSTEFDLQIPPSFSVDTWVNLALYPEEIAPIVAKWNDLDANERGFILAITHQGTVRFDVSTNGRFAGGNSVILTSPNSDRVPLNKWTHLAAVFDSTAQALYIYIDGQRSSAAGAPFSTVYNPDEPLLIGAGDMGSSQRYYFNGLIDEVEIFGRALSAAEVQSIYAAGATSRCRTGR